jgi:hypothetical protein
MSLASVKIFLRSSRFPEYIIIMIGNGKTADDINKELKDLIGDEDANRFSQSLGEEIKKYVNKPSKTHKSSSSTSETKKLSSSSNRSTEVTGSSVTLKTVAVVPQSDRTKTNEQEKSRNPKRTSINSTSHIGISSSSVVDSHPDIQLSCRPPVAPTR